MHATAAFRGRLLPTSTGSVIVAAAYSIWTLVQIKVNSVTAWILFCMWLTAPCVGTCIALYKVTKSPCASRVAGVFTIVGCVGSIYFLYDVTALHGDAQAPIAILMLPVFQYAFAVITVVVGMFLCSDHRRQSH